MSKIVDISKHQGSVNFSTMKKAGVEGVVLRCGYSSKKDIRFDEYYAAAKKQGLPIGSYHYATFHYSGNSTDKTAVEKAKAQAETAIAFLKGKTIDAFVALDLELEPGTSTPLSRDAMTKAANAYMDTLKKAGYTPCLYCSVSWLYDKMNPANVKYPLWLAYYHKSGKQSTEFPNTSYGLKMKALRSKIWLWQYAEDGNGKKYGVSSTGIDVNHCYRAFSTMASASTAAPAPTKSTASTIKTYTVKKGDTLSEIAGKYGITYQQLASHNGIADPNKISVGQVLKIPGASPSYKVHTVKSGESLSSIASKYGTTYQALAKYNNIKNPDLIRKGQKIKIPN